MISISNKISSDVVDTTFLFIRNLLKDQETKCNLLDQLDRTCDTIKTCKRQFFTRETANRQCCFFILVRGVTVTVNTLYNLVNERKKGYPLL